MTIVCGIAKVNGTVKDTGKAYSGYRVYCEEDRKNVDGHACYNLYVSDNKFPAGLMVGDQIRVCYNRFGKVDSIEVA